MSSDEKTENVANFGYYSTMNENFQQVYQDLQDVKYDGSKNETNRAYDDVIDVSMKNNTYDDVVDSTYSYVVNNEDESDYLDM